MESLKEIVGQLFVALSIINFSITLIWIIVLTITPVGSYEKSKNETIRLAIALWLVISILWIICSYLLVSTGSVKCLGCQIYE